MEKEKWFKDLLNYFENTMEQESEHSHWYKLLESYIEKNIDYRLAYLKEEGCWQPNFSWGLESETSRQVTVYWQFTWH